jgi:predicted homoserine dehydrogenase-like protein
VTQRADLLCTAERIDALVDVTGAMEFGAGIAWSAIEQRKPLISMNIEVDATIGPILQDHAARSGVVSTCADGDQPGVIVNLFRFVQGIGVRPVLCGNIKGLQDPYRNPTTQESFAKRWGQNPRMVTSFADGSKISIEQASVANATGMGVGQLGMFGPTVEPGTPIQEAPQWYPLDRFADGPGIVDYVVGAHPAPGVFVIGRHDHPQQRHYLNLYKLGEGPYYVFYRPYHLCHFEVPGSVARAVLFGDPTVAPLGRPYVDCVTTAKVDLPAGTILDGIGGYHTYGQAENAERTIADRLLPMGLSEGCRTRRALAKDALVRYDDIELPPGRLLDRLRREQDARFFDGAKPMDAAGSWTG